MTASLPARAHPAAAPDPFTVLSAAAIALAALSLVWSAVDTRLVDGVEVWRKPLKFALSFIIHFGTLALVLQAMSPAARESLAIRIAAAVMAAAFLGEMAYMFVQAAQAQASHFNLSTPFHQVMYGLMGVGAVLLIAMPLLVVGAAVRDRGAAFGPATRSGLTWGALLSFGLTLVVAGTLSSMDGHYIGTSSDPARTLPFLGWSTEVGDLRPAHFLSLHALQALPLLGLWLDRTGRGTGAMRIAAAGWAALTLALYAQALMGLPVIRL